MITGHKSLTDYRQARWRAVILYGMTGIGKTVIARALADNEQVMRAFRDGVAWIDGSRDPEEEVMRLCLAQIWCATGRSMTPATRWRHRQPKPSAPVAHDWQLTWKPVALPSRRFDAT